MLGDCGGDGCEQSGRCILHCQHDSSFELDAIFLRLLIVEKNQLDNEFGEKGRTKRARGREGGERVPCHLMYVVDPKCLKHPCIALAHSNIEIH